MQTRSGGEVMIRGWRADLLAAPGLRNLEGMRQVASQSWDQKGHSAKAYFESVDVFSLFCILAFIN